MYQATSSTWSLSLGSKRFLPTGKVKKAMIKVTTRSNLLRILTVSTAQSHFFFSFTLTRIKRHQEYHKSFHLSKLLSLWEKGRTMSQSQHRQQPRIDPTPAVGSGLQLSLLYEETFLPGPLQLLLKLSEG